MYSGSHRSRRRRRSGLATGRLGRAPAWRRVGTVALCVAILVDLAALAAVLSGAFQRERDLRTLAKPPATAGSPTPPVPSPSPAREKRRCQEPALIGTVTADEVVAREAPRSSAELIETFPRISVVGITQVFSVLDVVQGKNGKTWYKALLPIHPNGTTGFIPAKGLELSHTWYRLQVSRERFRLTLFEGCRKARTFPVGIGTVDTPTPVGRFYLAGLFKPPDPNSVYGAYVYTLSGYSEVLTNWELGGIIGLHGPNNPSSIGQYSSHGCIRMLNEDIMRLRKILPIGTPIVIR
jgi:L,D-transpeptidase catalytic domain